MRDNIVVAILWISRDGALTRPAAICLVRGYGATIISEATTNGSFHAVGEAVERLTNHPTGDITLTVRVDSALPYVDWKSAKSVAAALENEYTLVFGVKS